MSPPTPTDVQKTRAERPPLVAGGLLRLLRVFGWRAPGARRRFGDERNPLVARALAAIPGRVGPAALLSSGFLDPHSPACERIELRALFYNGSRLFEYRADLTPDHEDWRFLPLEGDSSDYHPLVVAEEDGRQFRREFHYRLEQMDQAFGVVLRKTPPRRFPVSPAAR